MIGWVPLWEVLTFLDKHMQRPNTNTFLLVAPPL